MNFLISPPYRETIRSLQPRHLGLSCIILHTSPLLFLTSFRAISIFYVPMRLLFPRFSQWSFSQSTFWCVWWSPQFYPWFSKRCPFSTIRVFFHNASPNRWLAIILTCRTLVLSRDREVCIFLLLQYGWWRRLALWMNIPPWKVFKKTIS